jgi:hypothetical protein
MSTAKTVAQFVICSPGGEPKEHRTAVAVERNGVVRVSAPARRLGYLLNKGPPIPATAFIPGLAKVFGGSGVSHRLGRAIPAESVRPWEKGRVLGWGVGVSIAADGALAKLHRQGGKAGAKGGPQGKRPGGGYGGVVRGSWPPLPKTGGDCRGKAYTSLSGGTILDPFDAGFGYSKSIW